MGYITFIYFSYRRVAWRWAEKQRIVTPSLFGTSNNRLSHSREIPVPAWDFMATHHESTNSVRRSVGKEKAQLNKSRAKNYGFPDHNSEVFINSQRKVAKDGRIMGFDVVDETVAVPASTTKPCVRR